MRIKSKNYKAYLTVYLSLVFGIILSLLLTLTEGAATGAARLQSELVADMGMDSIFAEYHRELLNQYDVFYIDDSYGMEKGGLGRTQMHLADYLSYNCNPNKDNKLSGRNCFLKLENPYLEIEAAAYATDNCGEVWKAQAIDYMRDIYGIGMISQCKGYLSITQNQALATRNLKEELAEQKQEFEESLVQKEIYETDLETQDGYSYTDLDDLWDSISGRGILNLIMTDVSDKVVHKEEYVSNRKINQGCGLPKYVEKPTGLDDELLYGEYIMQKCGNYRNRKTESGLDYEVEYILYGKESDLSNLRECAEHLLALRAVSNYIYLTTKDTVKKSEVDAVSVLICTLLTVPELSEALSAILLGTWAYVEAVADVRCLFDGGRVPLIKEQGEWNTDLWGLLKGMVSYEEIQSGSDSTGLSYQDYLRIFLGMMDRQDKVMRSLDIVEMDIRRTPGNEHFRIDQCVDYLKVSFGFSDTRGHDFVFTRSMRYE